MNDLKFSDNSTFPKFGLGTWLARPDDVYNAVIHAVKSGYRHIDCAYIYKNEKEVGAALKKLFDDEVVKREELFITSKLWNHFHEPDKIDAAVQSSLNDLQLDYLDLYLIHWPFSFRKEMPESVEDLISPEELPLTTTWKGMENLKKAGIVRHIGMSNFSIKKLKEIIEVAEIKPEVNQVEIHPYFQQNELVDFCQQEGILVTAYSPLGSRHLMKTDDSITNDPVIRKIAAKHNATEAQIMLAWNLHRGVAVIPKSITESRITENFAALDVRLDSDDMTAIAALDKGRRNAKGLFAVLPGGPYTYENIWDEDESTE